MTRFILACYGDAYAVTDEVYHAFDGAEHHIRTCPRGAMPWAHPHWYGANGENTGLSPGWSAANNGWLNHHILVSEE